MGEPVPISKRESVQIHPYIKEAQRARKAQLGQLKSPPSFAWVGPAALALFAYASQIKEHPWLAWIPGDLTAISAVIAGFAFLIARGKNGPGVGAIAWPFILWFLFMFGTVNASLDTYAVDKLATLYTFTLFAAIAPFHLLRFPEQRKVFVTTLAFISVGAAALTLAGSATAGSNALLLDGSTTIGTARMAGTGVLIFAIFAITMRVRRVRRLMFAAVAVGLLGVLVMTGSRGPFLGILVGLVAVLLFGQVLTGRRASGFFWSAVLASVGFWWAATRTVYGGDRAFAWLSGERDNSTNTREYLWDITLADIAWEPFGVGWGDFTESVGAAPHLQYPHNLILEVFHETGWFVGSVMLMFIVASTIRLWRRSTDPVGAVLFALLLFSLANAMVSGDINANRLMWVLLSVAWVIPGKQTQSATDEPALPNVGVAGRRSHPPANPHLSR